MCVGGGQLHALIIGGLNIFIRSILEYIDIGGLHALDIGGLNNFMRIILEYIVVGVLHVLVIGGLNNFMRIFWTTLMYFFWGGGLRAQGIGG